MNHRFIIQSKDLVLAPKLIDEEKKSINLKQWLNSSSYHHQLNNHSIIEWWNTLANRSRVSDTKRSPDLLLKITFAYIWLHFRSYDALARFLCMTDESLEKPLFHDVAWLIMNQFHQSKEFLALSLVDKRSKDSVFDHMRHKALSFLAKCTTDEYGEFDKRTLFHKVVSEMINSETNIKQLKKLMNRLERVYPFADVMTQCLRFVNKWEGCEKLGYVKVFSTFIHLLSLHSFQSKILEYHWETFQWAYQICSFLSGFYGYGAELSKSIEKEFKNRLGLKNNFANVVWAVMLFDNLDKFVHDVLILLQKYPSFPEKLLHFVFRYDVTSIINFMDKLTSVPVWNKFDQYHQTEFIFHYCPRLPFIHDIDKLQKQIIQKASNQKHTFSENTVNILLIAFSFIDPKRINDALQILGNDCLYDICLEHIEVILMIFDCDPQFAKCIIEFNQDPSALTRISSGFKLIKRFGDNQGIKLMDSIYDDFDIFSPYSSSFIPLMSEKDRQNLKTTALKVFDIYPDLLSFCDEFFSLSDFSRKQLEFLFNLDCDDQESLRDEIFEKDRSNDVYLSSLNVDQLYVFYEIMDEYFGLDAPEEDSIDFVLGLIQFIYNNPKSAFFTRDNQIIPFDQIVDLHHFDY